MLVNKKNSTGYNQASDSTSIDNLRVGNVGNCEDKLVAITDNDRVGNVGNQANERPMITDNVGNVDIKSRDRGKNMLRLLDIFTEYPHFSIAEAANMLGIVKRTAERYASQLQKGWFAGKAWCDKECQMGSHFPKWFDK